MTMSYKDTVFGKSLTDVDPQIADIIRYEQTRQAGKIILIPSESICPAPVLEALGSAFSNIYAEGYIPSMMDGEEENILANMDFQLPRYRRYSDRRFYKGCEYANFVEAIASRRAAALFATRRNPPENIFVNVQSLSGSIANNVVYDTFVKPGETVMGMSLMHGGHLTHGSEFNRSGKNYRIVSYEVSAKTGRLDYDEIAALVQEHHPRMIIAGYTSYPWAPDWKRFKKIADSVGAVLLADISHPAGLIAAGVFPSPIDYADVTVTTTHKTLFGPRGAIIMTTSREYAQLIDQAVFPGEQGGPHVNKFAAMAVAFKIAMSDGFKQVQRNIVQNAKYLGEVLQKRGLGLAYGGTDSHLLLIDLNSVETKYGFPLKGETAVRVLDLCGIVANKNTIPGDLVTAEASGVRMGTPWITQRGITREGIDELGDIIATVLKSINPFSYIGLTGTLPRGKIELEILEKARKRVKELAGTLVSEHRELGLGYPHDSIIYSASGNTGDDTSSILPEDSKPGDLVYGVIEVKGTRAFLFLEGVSTGKITTMKPGESCKTLLFGGNGKLIAPAVIHRLKPDRFLVISERGDLDRLLLWFRGLSDGYVAFDSEDIFRKIDGPVTVRGLGDMTHDERVDIGKSLQELSSEGLEIPPFARNSDVQSLFKDSPELFDLSKTYFIAQKLIDHRNIQVKKRVFSPDNPANTENPKSQGLTSIGTKGEPGTSNKTGIANQKSLKQSCLFEEHRKLNAQMVEFAGWHMPVRYESIIEEHRAVREKVGLFDISHMGILSVTGRYATQFLDTVSSNYVPWINAGESQYGYLLDPRGNVIDDIMIYKRSDEDYIVVVNAVNNDVDVAWLQAVNSREFIIDQDAPFREILAEVTIQDLKGEGLPNSEALVDVALQGPESLEVLRKLLSSDGERSRLDRLEKTKFMETALGGIDVIVSRTGYTGEEFGYELFVSPGKAPRLWNLLLHEGKNFGIKPIGLGARDSLRTEVGLPLHGHELAGLHNISPIEAGFGPYVKFHKAFFIGRDALLKGMQDMGMAVARFRMTSRGVRIAKPGDIVLSSRTQRVIGNVTSCAVDAEGVQVGMAYVNAQFAREDVRIGIIPAQGREASGSRGELAIGDRFPLPAEAVVLSRFPEPEESEA